MKVSPVNFTKSQPSSQKTQRRRGSDFAERTISQRFGRHYFEQEGQSVPKLIPLLGLIASDTADTTDAGHPL